jgi:protein ImuB
MPRLERQGFAEPVQTEAPLAHGMAQLLDRLCRRLDAEGLGVRRLEFAGYRVDSRIERVAIGTSRPTRDPRHLQRLLVPRIAAIDPGPGIEVITLSALEVAPQGADALALAALDGPGEAAAEDGTAALIDRLANRLGPANVLRAQSVDSHRPERAGRWISAFEAVPAGAWPAQGQRPIRLLAHPDPVEIVAPVPDDPPILFRWRRIVHRVRHAEGPERIAAEWWRDGTGIRDYYRVEDAAGRRFWLYRDGLYRPDTAARWFLHGFFG